MPHISVRAFVSVVCSSLLLMTACGAQSVASTPTLPVFPTLPPTWTPAPSITPAPPTAPPTLTPSPSPTATLTAAELCASFTLLYEIPGGAQFMPDGVIPLALTLEAAGPVVRFIAVQRDTGANQGVQIPGGQTALFELPVASLAGPGIYDWTLGVYVDGSDTPLCARSGTFEVLPPRTPAVDWLVPRRATATPHPAGE